MGTDTQKVRRERLHTLTFVNFTELTDPELMEILAWRNLPHIRDKMTHSEVIAPEDHLRFCHALKNRPDLLFLRIDVNGQKAGVSTSRFDFEKQVIEPGVYYINHAYAAAKVGIALGFIYESYGMHEVRLEVKKGNHEALLFNALKTGATLTGEDEHYLYLRNPVPLPYRDRLEHTGLTVKFYGIPNQPNPWVMTFA